VTSASSCQAGAACQPTGRVFPRALRAPAADTGGLFSRVCCGRVKNERSKRETDSLVARHERAELIRRKRDGAPLPQSVGASAPPAHQPIAPTVVFGGPVRGFTFSRVCNLRADTPGPSSHACRQALRTPPRC